MTFVRILFLPLLLYMGVPASGQDLSGTWSGSLVTQGVRGELPRVSRMSWELVQDGGEVYGIIYFFPQDTHPGDQANAIYTWFGKMGQLAASPFNFIQGRFLEGLGSSTVYLFQVEYRSQHSVEVLQGKWFTQLEALHTGERPNGSFTLRRSGNYVSHPEWKQHGKEWIRVKSMRLLKD